MFVPKDNSPRHHQAFTLVELIVVMSIMVILATLSISGFQSVMDRDRVGETASTLRATLEGARARAVKSGEPRGVRLLLAEDDGRIVTSLAYIGPPKILRGYLRVESDGSGNWRVFDSTETVDPYQVIVWSDLYERDLIIPGMEIKLRINGSTEERFNLVTRIPNGGMGMGMGMADDAWVLNRAYPYTTTPMGLIPRNPDPKEPTAGFGLPSMIASEPIEYSIEFYPAILEGTAPIPLPPDTCIDLDGSRLPAHWRPASTPLDPTRNYGPVNTVASGVEELPMDILFTREGTVDRKLLAEGFLIFRVARTSDIQAARINLPGALPNTTLAPVVVRDPEYSAKLVTLVTQTGMLRISNVYGEGSTSTASPPQFNTQLIVPENPFYSAILGREAKQ